MSDEARTTMRGAHPGTRIVLILAIATCSACSLIRGTLQLPDKAIQAVLPMTKEGKVLDPVDLQADILRFSNHFLDMMTAAIGQLQEEGSALKRLDVQQRRLFLANDVIGIATGSNAYANLLDMVILVTLTRMRIEDYWLPKRFGDSAKPLLKVAKDSEARIWAIAGDALRPEQLAELRKGIRLWYQQNPDSLGSRSVGGIGISDQIARIDRTRTPAPTSVFQLLMIDPLSGLDPATRELEEARLSAERALFLAQHLPNLLRWEAEVLILRSTALPETQQMVNSAAQLAQSSERFSTAVAQFPEMLARERQHWMEALRSERLGLTELAGRSGEALTAGAQMADATDAALKTFQDVVRQLESHPSDPRSEPFRIRDYTAAAEQIDLAAAKLAELLQVFNQTIGPDNLTRLSARLEELNRQVEASGQALVDYAFRKTVWLILIACGAVLATYLVCRWLGASVARSRRV